VNSVVFIPGKFEDIMRDRFLHRPAFPIVKIVFWFFIICLASASSIVLFQTYQKQNNEKIESPKTPIQKPSIHQKIQQFEAQPQATGPMDWKLLFELPWGEQAPAVGGRGYDPGSGNGVSGGAMPLELMVDSKGDLFLADGYGPRMLHFSSNGRLQKVLDWELLRPLHFSSSPALGGYRWAKDTLGRWHILDTEKHQIHCFDQNGQWIKTHAIDSFFKDSFIIHDIHPVLQVAGKDLYFLQLTLSPLDEPPQPGMNQLPLQKYEQKGVWLDVCFGDLKMRDISYLPYVYGLDAWSISHTQDHLFFIQHERLQNMEWIVDKKWTLKDYHSQGGDLIGIDRQGLLYFWSGPNQVLSLDTIRNTYQYWHLPLAHVYHPVAVDPQGGLVLTAASDHFIRFYRWAPLTK
jgi:hypothetical protein